MIISYLMFLDNLDVLLSQPLIFVSFIDLMSFLFNLKYEYTSLLFHSLFKGGNRIHLHVSLLIFCVSFINDNVKLGNLRFK